MREDKPTAYFNMITYSDRTVIVSFSTDHLRSDFRWIMSVCTYYYGSPIIEIYCDVMERCNNIKKVYEENGFVCISGIIDCIPPDPDVINIYCKDRKQVKVCSCDRKGYRVVDCGKPRG